MRNEKTLNEVKYSLTKKLSVSFFSICIVVGIILASVTYLYNKHYTWNLFSKISTSCAIDVANMLHAAPFDKFLEGKEQVVYQNHLKSIKNIANTFKLKYLYVYIPDVKNNKLIAIYGVTGIDGSTIKDFKLGESPQKLKLNKQVMQMFNSKQKSLTIEMNNHYGHVVTGYSTITDANNNPVAIVGADIDFGHMQQQLKNDLLITYFIIFIALTLIYLLAIFYIKNTFIKPIFLLSTKMRNFVSNSTSRYEPIQLNTNDEFNVMGNSYNIMASNIKSLMKDIFDSQIETIFSLAKLIQTRDDSTGKHIERVQSYCKILAIAVMVFKLYPETVNKKFIKNLVSASPLHDIGKVAIADIVLINPKKLTDEELQKMQQHTILGELALSKIHSKFGHNDFIKTGMLIARSHHEKWDGTGYPDGLKGEEIPIAARISAIADVYDALATKRVYKKAFPHSKCVKIILEDKGKHFDPQLVDVFMKIEHKFLKIRQSFEAQEIRSFFDEDENSIL